MEELLREIRDELRAIRQSMGIKDPPKTFNQMLQSFSTMVDDDGYVYRAEDFNRETGLYEKYHHLEN